jgi:HD superfamily phosphohydrolase
MANEIKKFDSESAKKIVLSSVTFPNNKDSLLKDLSENILPKLITLQGDELKETTDRFNEKSMLLLRLLESDSHVGIMESFTEKYQMLSLEMCKKIIKEFDCSNEAEKALAELIVNAYLRVIDNSRRLNNEFECRNITPNRNVFIANLSKQLDRAHRQFTSTLMTLKQMKSPQIEMNIRATTAFVSQNQQINVDKKNNEA